MIVVGISIAISTYDNQFINACVLLVQFSIFYHTRELFVKRSFLRQIYGERRVFANARES